MRATPESFGHFSAVHSEGGMNDYLQDFYSNAGHHMSERRMSIRSAHVRTMLAESGLCSAERCIDIGGGLYSSLGAVEGLRDGIYIDISKEFCEKYESVYDTYHADVNVGLPPKLLDRVGEKSVDIVFCFEVLEHLFTADRLVEDCVAALKDGGVFIFSVPNDMGFYLRRLDAFLKASPYGHHGNPFSEQHIRFFNSRNIMNFCSRYLVSAADSSRQRGFASINLSGINMNLSSGIRERLGRPPFADFLAARFPQWFATNFLCCCMVGTR